MVVFACRTSQEEIYFSLLLFRRAHAEARFGAMYPFERRERILSKLHKTGQIRIGEDAKILGISASTIHRDLEELQKEGLVKKVRGGAVLMETQKSETHFDIRMKNRVKEKEEIARKAAELIQDDSCIFLDHSSTTVFLAREIRPRAFRNLVVITNSLVTPVELAGNSGIQVSLTGGVVMNEFKAVSGRWVSEALKRLIVHQVFVSIGSISLERGLMTQIPFIHEILPEVLQCGGQINVLADSSKFFKAGTFQIAPLSPSMRIFSDRKLPKDIIAQLQEKGTQVVI